ncbi:MAG TPA: FMN-binding protein [Candidatus Paceibacterota bacterium]|nr:FMN-binding protein [Candidatus Paceibacterota bacterium]
MKKTLLALVLVGASALYVFSRSAGASAPSGIQISNNVTAPAGGGAPAATPPAPVQPSSANSGNPPPAANPAATPATPPPAKSGYKDGTYTGAVADAYYGPVEVQATIKNGALANVSFLQYPNTHSTSVYINQQAMPMLSQEALSVQSANVDLISGATDTSIAFRQSLAAALQQAQS